MFTRKCMSIVLVFGFILAFVCGDLLAAEKGGNFSGIERFRGVSFDASLPAHNLLYMERIGYLKQHQAFQAPMFPQTYLLKVTDFESKEQKGEKPPLSGGRIAGEILAGDVGGIALGIAGVQISAELCEKDGELSRSGWLTVFTFGSIGCILGNTIGVYIVGNIGNETGSFLAAFLSSLAGFWGAGYSSWLAVDFMKLPTPGAPILIAYGAFFGASIGATIGFNLTRRYKSPHASETALINFSNGQMSLAVPSIYIRPDALDRRNLSQNVDLVRVRF